MSELHHYVTSVFNWLVRHWQWWVIGLGVFLLLVILATYMLVALDNALQFKGYALDGAFQLYNPMRRIAEGFVPGDGFQFFHGVGLAVMHFPLFWLLGGDLPASELTRWLVSPTFFLFSTGLVFWLLLRKWWATLLFTVITAAWCGTWIAGMIYPENSLLALRSVWPVFVMAVILYRDKLQLKRVWRFNAYELLAPLALAWALLAGTEHGIGALGAFILIELFFTRKTGLKNMAVQLGIKLGIYIAIVLVLATILTAGHPFGALSYALGQIPTDQFWYFGVPPNGFLEWAKIGDIFDPFTTSVMAFGAIVAAALIWLRKKPWLKPYLPAFWFGWLSGLIVLSISALGYFSGVQFIPWARLIMLVGLGVAGLALMQYIKSRQGKTPYGRYAVATTVLLLFWWAGSHVSTLYYNQAAALDAGPLVTKAYRHFITKSDTEYLAAGWQATLNGLVPIINSDNATKVVDYNDNGFKRGVNPDTRTVLVQKDAFTPLLRKGQPVYLKGSGRHIVNKATQVGDNIELQLEFFKPPDVNDGYPNNVVISERLDKSNTSEHVWSLYTSILDAELGVFAPNNGYDYIIHALGPKARADYVASFDRTQPKYVLTILHPYSEHSEWLEEASWGFFTRILNNYKAVAVTSSHVLWEKLPDHPWQQTDFAKQDTAPLTIKNGHIALPANTTDKPKVISVTVHYSLDSWLSKVPMLQKIPRYLLYPEGTRTWTPVSLPPYMDTWSFPIVLNPNQSSSSLRLAAPSLVPGAKLEITDVTYSEEQLGPENYQGFLGELTGPIKP